MTSEFDLIRRYFHWPVHHTDLGGGDDAALLTVPPGEQLAVSTDMLVEGRHFFVDTDPAALGWKSLAVNLSDIAAMGATPRWATLALALPDDDAPWLGAFAGGLRECADAYAIDLIGGDTTRGPRTINITIFGTVPTGRAIRRSGGRPGDELWISGHPGRAALALWHLRDGIALNAPWRDDCLHALHRPTPRTRLGPALRGLASAMLDVSDGLLGDLGHILETSGCGARIDAPALPVAPLIDACGDAALARRACLSGGDDYELLFAAPAAQRPAILDASRAAGVPVTRIGQLTEREAGLVLVHADGAREALTAAGFDHFADRG
ncbi:thiamine-phosphate kinase [Nitrogeniibacter mangrovi]|uniref:Thiamine-monophosphate kinase n=1 Tax=Nitrogeniibacter mangrovi TaxID=2016596 RepID=A0A6C1AYR3_9RHOO|nr:thiamine-phosphate kinase [Nitrogeniibacter mangrovi]QID16511.1 thiamine-phosphate kinase [Nitrogeniibacter mangrovi]